MSSYQNIPKVYIQKSGDNYADDWLFAAHIGFSKLGFEIINFEEIEEVPCRKDIYVVAFIEDTLKYFKSLKLDLPQTLNIPDKLNQPKFLNRKVQKTTWLELKQITINNPLFVKPLKIKEFLSGVITSLETLNGLNLQDDTQILTSEAIDMDSEWRIFVHDGKIVGAQWYAGDPFLSPNKQIVEEMINHFTDSPIGYTLDVCVNSDGTFLIECNDGWSIGNYGLEGKAYAKLLRDRWRQIMS